MINGRKLRYLNNQFPCDSTINLRIGYCEPLGGIGESTLNALKVVPNPFQSDFKLETTGEITPIRLVDISGNELPFEYVKTSEEIHVKTKDLENGLYFLQTDGGVVQLIKYGE